MWRSLCLLGTNPEGRRRNEVTRQGTKMYVLPIISCSYFNLFFILHTHTHTQCTQHSAIKEFVSFMEELCSLLREVSRPFRPFPSVGRQLLNLEEEIRHCQPPFEDRNVSERDGEWEGVSYAGRQHHTN